MADDRAVGAPERLHPLFLLTGLGPSLRGAAGGYAVVIYLIASGRAGTAFFGFAALLLFMITAILLHWLRFEYRVGADEIRIDSGILSRTHRSIPFDRVQDVDITQGPVARLLGIARVKFETGGSAGTDKDDGVLAAIPLERAEALRQLVRGRRAGQALAHDAVADTEGEPIYAMSTRRLVTAGMLNFSLALFAGLFGLSQTLGDVLGFDPFRRAFWLSVLSATGPLRDFVMAHSIVTGLAGVLLLIVIGLATGIVRTAIRDFGFRLDRAQAGLRRRRGLFTKTDVTLPINRAQAALVLTGPIRDAFGWRELKLQSLARDEGNKGDHQLAPLASDPEVDAILNEIGWRPVPAEAPWTGVSKAYLWTFLAGLIPLGLIAFAQAAAIGGLADAEARAPLLLVPLAIVAALGAAFAVRWLSWRHTAYALDGKRLLVRTGWWRRRTLLLPLDRLQSVDISESLFSRLFGTANLVFGVAGGKGFAEHRIPAVERETARRLRDQLLG